MEAISTDFFVFPTQTIVLGLMTILYATACYWMVGMEPDIAHFIYFTVVLFFVINISCAICQCIAAVVNTVPMAVCAYMMVVAYMLLFGGFIVRSDQLPDWMRWSLEVCQNAIFPPPLVFRHNPLSLGCRLRETKCHTPFSK
jgi:hypothetical protein